MGCILECSRVDETAEVAMEMVYLETARGVVALVAVARGVADLVGVERVAAGWALDPMEVSEAA
jgi:Holliday junction resolvasome RuvABC endonuclease subunit